MTPASVVGAIRHPQRQPRVVEWCATGPGRVAVVAAASVLLWPHDPWLALLIVPLAAIAPARPDVRQAALSIAGVIALYRLAADKQATFLDASTGGQSLLPPAVVVLWLGALYVCFRAAVAIDALPALIRRHPQIALHAVSWAALGAAWFIPARAMGGPGALRLAAACVPFFVWRCGYLLLSGRRGTVSGTAFRDHLFYLSPPWGGSSTPYGKGHDGLRDVRADEPLGIARAQVAGLKLLCLAWTWMVADQWLSRLVHSRAGLGFPSLAALIEAGADAHVVVPVAWAVVLADLVHRVLALATAGHMIVGSLRLCGFYALRNTYKPLLSESLVDFWNRYYFYFKELMVEFFFYPTYATWFRSRPALRLYAAVFASACLGNTYYHVLIGLPELAAAGPAGALRLLAPRAFYTVLLATGICLSMQRQRALRGRVLGPVTLVTRVRRIAGVWLFFALINIWNEPSADVSLPARTAFFLSLFGWS